jgi:NAD(P)H-flavin reductase
LDVVAVRLLATALAPQGEPARRVTGVWYVRRQVDACTLERFELHLP